MVGRRVLCGVLAMSLLGSCGEQMNGSVGTTGGSAMVAPAQSFEAMLTIFETQITGVAKAMPEGKYGFAPTAAIFKETQETKYEGVRTFGAMVGHIAMANYYYYGQIGGMKPTVDVKAIGALTGKDELLAALAASFAFGRQALATITSENAFARLGKDGVTTRASLAGGVMAHGYDHYGQLAEYLRMNGLAPPASAR